MDERVLECPDGSRWKVVAPTRSSPYRLLLVFESLDSPGQYLRNEVAARALEELSDRELCFMVADLRAAGDS